MLNSKKLILFFLIVLLKATASSAFQNDSWTLGFSYFSQNVFYKTSQSDTAKKGLLGESSLPLQIKYDQSLYQDWFIAPQLSYTLFPRTTKDSAAEVTTMILTLQFGKNWGRAGDWDWHVGPGYLSYKTKGKGGTVELNNGGGTSTFALPSGSSEVNKIIFSAGFSYNLDRHRFGADLIVESLFSSLKRTENISLSYGYRFGGSRSSRPSSPGRR